jgi:adenine specific DNA methylase Mod
MEYLIRTYTNEGETVLDNTMGSGTTMIACLNTNRAASASRRTRQERIFAHHLRHRR